MTTFRRFLAKIEHVRRASFENLDIETDIQICKVKETSNVSSFDRHVITRSEKTKNQLNILETVADYPEKPIYDQLEVFVSPKGNERQKIGTTSANLRDNDRCQDETKLNDHTATHPNSC